MNDNENRRIHAELPDEALENVAGGGTGDIDVAAAMRFQGKCCGMCQHGRLSTCPYGGFRQAFIQLGQNENAKCPHKS